MIEVKSVSVGYVGANCYIVQFEDKDVAIIDPGDEPERILSQFDPNNLKWILLTHGHADHIMAANYIKEKYNPQIIASDKEKEMLENPDTNLSSRFDAPCKVIADVYIDEGVDKILLGEHEVKIIHAPGHTPGSLIYIIEKYMFTGDTIFKDSIGRMDFPGGNPQQMKSTLRLLSSIQEDYIVFPGHGESTTLRREQKHNPYFLYF